MSKINDGGYAFPDCKWCNEKACVKQGHIWLCQKHYRFLQMRANAKRHKKIVPSYETLENLLEETNMKCPICRRSMNWLGKEGQETVLTLQHDRSGKLNFLCRSCNTRHASFPFDWIYAFNPNMKICPRCKTVKNLTEFGYDFSGRWKNRRSYCKLCSNNIHREWVGRNRNHVNQMQRENRKLRSDAMIKERDRDEI